MLKNQILDNKDYFFYRTYNYLNLMKGKPKYSINKKNISNNKIPLLAELINYLYMNKTDNNNYDKFVKYLEKTNIQSPEFRQYFIKNIEYNDSIKSNFLPYILSLSKYNIPENQQMLYNTKFTSLLHLILINESITHQYNINFSYKIDKIEISNNNPIVIYSNDDCEELKSDKWLKQLILRYCLFNYLLDHTKTPDSLLIFLIDFPKELYANDDGNNIIGPAEINTGITNGYDIIITRKEEALKTLLHELIHLHKLDFRYVNPKLNNMLNRKYQNLTNYTTENQKLNLFESYTEFIASIYNIILHYSNISHPSKMNFNDCKKYFKTELKKQVEYTNQKCQLLLQHFNCNKLEKCKIIQYTNMLSYFFIKNILYKNINKCMLNIVELETLKFIESYHSFKILYNLIENDKTKKKSSITKKLENKIKTKKQNVKMNFGENNRTLKMTILEI